MILFLILIGAPLLLIGIVTGFAYGYVKRQGDSKIVLLTESIEVPEFWSQDSKNSITRPLVFKNIGSQDGVLVDVRISANETLNGFLEPQIVREGTHPSELGYWVANILQPGESCVGNLSIEISPDPSKPLRQLNEIPVTVTFDEVGRGLLVSKIAKVKVLVSATASATGEE